MESHNHGHAAFIAARILLITSLLSACSLAPPFAPPKDVPPAAFKEAEKGEGAWKIADPQTAADLGKWWTIFNDAQLDALQDQAMGANQTLKVAAARIIEARAVAGISSPDYLPNISAGVNASRSAFSASSFGGTGSVLSTDYTARAAASWEMDLFGRVKNTHEALLLDAQGQEADYRGVLLSLQSDVAQNYFALRTLDTERQLLRRAMDVRTEAARIMEKRFKAGTAGEQDYARVKAELESARADLAALDQQRAVADHALSVLLGKAPSDFSFTESPLESTPPAVPAGLPSALLERRPDIAKAMLGMASANARIGAARAAFFPNLTLTAAGGFENATLGDVFKWSSRSWSLGQTGGLALSLPIFDNGKNAAGLSFARAAYDEAVATYRQQVLTAFRDVEDSLSAQRLLAQQSTSQEAAAASAARVLHISQTRYDAGEAEYLEVNDADRIALGYARAAVQVRGQRFAATIGLIRALGGGWKKGEEIKK